MFFNKKINLSTATVHGDEIEYINEAFEKNWVAPLGFNCDNFESEVCKYLCEDEAMHALSVTSGTAAIHLALRLAGVKAGDVVLCSDMTFVASVNPVCYEGGIPVFVDSERETWNMDPVALEKAFKKYPNAKAVVLVDLYGTPAKMDEILELCEKYGAILIEDSAEALSAMYKGKKCGTFGKYGIFSFNGNKIITTSGGGMLITEDKKARDRAFFLATQAKLPEAWYQHDEIGYNYRMSNIVAGIGRGQLKYIEQHRVRKTEIYNRYKDGLKGLPLTLNPHEDCAVPNYWLSCILLDKNCGVAPMDIFNTLKNANVEARPIWKPMHMQPLYENNDFVRVEEDPVDADIFLRGLCLPSDIKMTEEEQNFVMDVVRSCF